MVEPIPETTILTNFDRHILRLTEHFKYAIELTREKCLSDQNAAILEKRLIIVAQKLKMEAEKF